MYQVAWGICKRAGEMSTNSRKRWLRDAQARLRTVASDRPAAPSALTARMHQSHPGRMGCATATALPEDETSARVTRSRCSLPPQRVWSRHTGSAVLSPRGRARPCLPFSPISLLLRAPCTARHQGYRLNSSRSLPMITLQPNEG